MASSPDAMRARIEAYHWPPQRGGVEVVRANKGYTLYHYLGSSASTAGLN
jgi:hypothetical protein